MGSQVWTTASNSGKTIEAKKATTNIRTLLFGNCVLCY